MWIIPFCATVVLILICLFTRRQNVWFRILLLWIFALTCLSNGGPDFRAYIVTYNNTAPVTFGENYLFSMINQLCRAANISFPVLIFFMGLVTILALAYTIKKYSKRPAFALALLSIYPLVEVIIQKRFNFGFSLIAIALPLLQYRNTRKTLIFVLSVLVASLIHSSLILFLIFSIIPYISKKDTQYVIIFGFIAFSIIASFGSEVFSLFVSDHRVELYTDDISLQIPLWKKAVLSSLHVALVAFINTKLVTKSDKFSMLCRQLNLISLVIVPLYFVNFVFFRVLRNLLPLAYIAISNYNPSETMKIGPIKIKKYLSATMLATSLFLYFFCFTGDIGFNGLVKPLFEDNYLFGSKGDYAEYSK